MRSLEPQLATPVGGVVEKPVASRWRWQAVRQTISFGPCRPDRVDSFRPGPFRESLGGARLLPGRGWQCRCYRQSRVAPDDRLVFTRGAFDDAVFAVHLAAHGRRHIPNRCAVAALTRLIGSHIRENGARRASTVGQSVMGCATTLSGAGSKRSVRCRASRDWRRRCAARHCRRGRWVSDGIRR